LFHPSATAIKHMIGNVGVVFEEHKEKIQQTVLAEESIAEEAKIVVASADGVNVLLREKGSCNRRPAERPGKSGEDDQCLAMYRNAMVGSISFYSGEMIDDEPQRLSSRYVSRMPQDKAVEFKKTFEQEIGHILADPVSETMKKVLLLDGSRALWAYTQSNELFGDFIPVIDFYHVTEHLSRAAEALFGKCSAEADTWYTKWKGKLLEDHDAAAGLLHSIDYYSNQIPLSKTRRDQLKTERTFFRRNRSRMPYARLRAEGMPIGSGPVEAACKSIVKTRLCRSGMRWSRKGGQNILTFRTLVKSHRWDAAWKCYRELKKVA
jgi:hypothetical protein